jgi:hypothetical protein
MNAKELAVATKVFDGPLPRAKTKPLSAAERGQFERLRRSPHRSVFVSRGSDGVYVRLDPKLLKRSTRYAADHKLTLSDVISEGLRGLLASK